MCLTKISVLNQQRARCYALHPRMSKCLTPHECPYSRIEITFITIPVAPPLQNSSNLRGLWIMSSTRWCSEYINCTSPRTPLPDLFFFIFTFSIFTYTITWWLTASNRLSTKQSLHINSYVLRSLNSGTVWYHRRSASFNSTSRKLRLLT